MVNRAANPFTAAATTPLVSDPIANLSAIGNRIAGQNQFDQFEALQNALIQQGMQQENQQFMTSEQNKSIKNVLDAVGSTNAASLLPNIQGIENVVSDVSALDPIALLNQSLTSSEVGGNLASAQKSAAEARESSANIGDTLDNQLSNIIGGQLTPGAREPLRIEVARETAKAKQDVKPIGRDTEKGFEVKDGQVTQFERERDVFPEGDQQVAPEFVDGLEVPVGIKGVPNSAQAKVLDGGRVIKLLRGSVGGEPVTLGS